MRMETFIRKTLRLKAHRVVKIEEDEAAGELTVYLDRIGERRLRCGMCGRPTQRVAGIRRPERRWRDLAMREHLVELVYAPHRVWCVRCGLRVKGHRKCPTCGHRKVPTSELLILAYIRRHLLQWGHETD
jgi:transposase